MLMSSAAIRTANFPNCHFVAVPLVTASVFRDFSPAVVLAKWVGIFYFHYDYLEQIWKVAATH